MPKNSKLRIIWQVFLGLIIGSFITKFLVTGKSRLKKVIGKITTEEITSIIQFITIAFIILPLIPNAYYGPYEALNPYIIWSMVVVISGISFLSYVAIKLIGPNKGISLSGFLGGLISSTAVTLTFSAKSKKHLKIVNPFVFGIIIASTAMFFRIFIEVFAVNADLLPYVALPLLAAGGTGLLLSIGIWILQKKEIEGNAMIDTEKVDLGKPLDLWAALKFGGVFAFVLLFAKYMSVNYGAEGVYLTSILSGIVDTDAITVSLANLAKNQNLDPEIAAVGITLATLTNTFVKGIFVLFLGSRAVAIRTIISVMIIIAVSLSTILLI